VLVYLFLQPKRRAECCCQHAQSPGHAPPSYVQYCTEQYACIASLEVRSDADLALALGVENKSDNQATPGQFYYHSHKPDHLPVKAQDFAENKDQDHADKHPRLVHESTYTLVSNIANAVPGSKTCQTDRQTAGKMQETAIAC
jgi:hypothetical protein